MKYNTLRASTLNGEWILSVSRSSQEREEITTVPDPLGFYHYPTTMPLEDAVAALKEVMIQRHKEVIANLQDSIQKLKKAKCRNHT